MNRTDPPPNAEPSFDREPALRADVDRGTTSDTSSPTVGVYDRPERSLGTNGTLIIGAVVLVILIILAILAFMFIF